MELTIPSADGASFSAYCELPDATPAPGIVLLSPIFGVDEDMRYFVKRYAKRGYVAVAPDLFWRIVPGPLSRTGEGHVRALERKKKVDVARERSDVAATIAHVRAMPQCSGRVAALGICFGGRYAVLAAADGQVEAAGAYHASEAGLELEALARTKVPVSLHYGDSDPVAPISEVNAIQKVLDGKSRSQVCLYRGAHHNFSIPGHPAYDAAAAQAAEARVFAEFDRLK